METKFLENTISTLENHLKKAMNEIALDNENIINATDKIKSLELEICKL